MVNPGYQQKVAAITLLLHVLLFAGTGFDAPGAAEIQRVQPKDVLNSSQGTEAKGGYISMNFRDVDILVLIKFISELTGRNFLVDPDVRGNVTILSPQKVTVDEAYRVFLSVLERKHDSFTARYLSVTLHVFILCSSNYLLTVDSKLLDLILHR